MTDPTLRTKYLIYLIGIWEIVITNYESAIISFNKFNMAGLFIENLLFRGSKLWIMYLELDFTYL